MHFDTERYKPYPELIEPLTGQDPYEIYDTAGQSWLPTNGMTDKEQRRIFVPLNEEGRTVSRHEMAHVLWSPTKIPRVRYDKNIFLAVEDARINLGLEHMGVGLELAKSELEHVMRLARRDLERGHGIAFVLRAVASLGTSAVEPLLALGEAAHGPECAGRRETLELARTIVHQVRDRMVSGRLVTGGPVTSVEHLLRISREVARMLGDAGHDVSGKSGQAIVLTGHGCCLERGVSKGKGEALDPALLHALQRHRSRRVTSGRMSIVEAPLTVGYAEDKGAGGRSWRSTTEGSVIQSVHRYAIDGAIFRRRVRRRGGSILIDTSGSMSLTVGEIDRIMRHAPSATRVAIYSGTGHEGELRIVAKDGRRAQESDLVPYGSGNVVDLPALEWLAKQPWPRVWVSDGGVTGVNDVGSQELRRQSRALCRQSRIQRVRDADQAARALEGRVA